MPRKPRGRSTDFNRLRFGKFLKAERKSKKLSQVELGAAADLSWQVISSLECGRATPTVDTLCNLAMALGIPPQILLEAGLTSAAKQHPVERGRAILDSLDPSRAEIAAGVLELLSRMRA
jgi:transcriptional regulator with XRE-family HTH domain